MKLTDDLKKQIDGMSYGALLSQWRFAPVGAPMFQGESGNYYAKRMNEMREKRGPEEHSATSKDIGW